MSSHLNARTDELRADFAKVTGKPFRHFFCPILLTDEPADLCMGHVVNEGFGSSVGTQIPQRADVDNFFGSVFEADLVALVKAEGKHLDELMADPSLRNSLRPHIEVDGETWPHYTRKGHPPENHTTFHMKLQNETSLEVVLKKSRDEVIAALPKKWAWVAEKDCTTAAVAALIKAAHLTLFSLLGYQYVFTTEGRYVAQHILGRFYRKNWNKLAREARTAAREFFAEFSNMVRPIEGIDGEAFRGTFEDNVVFCCEGSSGRPFALGVHVRLNEQVHSVLMPVFGHPDSVAAYLDFMKNSNESIAARMGHFDAAACEWKMSSCDPVRLRWPKEA